MDPSPQEATSLFDDPGQFILNYQQLIEVLVHVFIRSGYFPTEDKQEIIHSIIERLLIRMPKIKAQYNGHSRLKTYLSVIIRNLILERIREKQYLRKIEMVEEYNCEIEYHEDPLNRMIIDQEITRLGKILGMFCTKRKKLELCMKLIFRIPLKMNDFTEFRNDFQAADYHSYCRHFGQIHLTTDLDIYEWLTNLVNKYEGKDSSSDAMRKWIKQKLEEIIDLLNGTPQTSNYSVETLQILFEKYHEQNKENANKLVLKTIYNKYHEPC
jgi:hypothetical protein